jgi:trigger factor
MSVSVERKGNEATLKVSLPVEDVAKAFEKAVAKINKQVTIPGFRKGKAPRRVLELHVGKDAIKEEAFEIAANEQYREALKENSWVPVSDPEIKDSTFEEGKPMEMTLVVTLRPEPELGEYKGLEVEKKEKEITDADVDKEVENLQKRATKMVEAPEGKALEKGDLAIIDFAGTIDGEAFRRRRRQGLSSGSGSAAASSPASKISWWA